MMYGTLNLPRLKRLRRAHRFVGVMIPLSGEAFNALATERGSNALLRVAEGCPNTCQA
jgi:hypothetical protein